MELKWKLHQYTFKPTSYVTDEVRAIMGVKRGTLVAAVAVRIGETFDGTVSITIGDAAGAADGFVAAADVTEGSLGLYAGYGTYFSGANGHLYTEDDTIDLTYNYTSENGDTTTQGLATVYVVYAEIE